MALSSSGIGSGLNIDSLVSQLVQAEGQAPSLRLNKREAVLQADLSAIGQLKSALNGFKSALAGLGDPNAFLPRSATSSDTSLFSVSADTTAVAGSYSIEVLSLAASDKLRSNAFTDSTTEVIGTGTLDISLGATTFQVSVDSTNNTLKGIQDAINAASDNPGITASIVNVGAGPQLVLDSASVGAANTISVAVIDDDAGDGFELTRLDSANLTNVQSAQDASFNIDGQLATSSSNSVTNVISGVTIDLKKAAVGTTETLTVSMNDGGVKAKLLKFMTAYDKLADTMKSLSSFNQETKVGAILQGDPTLRGIENNLRNILTSPIAGLDYGTLAEMGIKTDDSGHLKMNDAQFDKVLAADFSAVSKLFSGDDGLVSRLSNALETHLAADGALESRTKSLNDSIKDVAGDREVLGRRLIAIEARYRKQFTAMDTLLGQLGSTSTYLAQQLANLPGVVNKNK